MDWLIWSIDKVGMLIVMLIAMKMGMRYMRAEIPSMIGIIKKNKDLLMPKVNIQQGLGLIAAHAAPEAGKAIGEGIRDLVRGWTRKRAK